MSANQTMVRVYRSPNAYRRDAEALARQGWHVASTSERRRRRSCVWIVLFFPVLLWPPKPEIVVTYDRSHPA